MGVYVARVKSGRKFLKRTLTARSRSEARKIAKRYGRVTSLKRDFLAELRPKLTREERDAILSRISSMAKSRVPMSKGIEKLRDTSGGSISRVASELLERTYSGHDLVGAMEASPRDFPPDVTTLIKAGAASGDTAKALSDAVEYERVVHKSKSNGLKGIWSGVFGIFFAAGSVILSQELLVGSLEDNPIMNSPQVDVAWVDPIAQGLIALSVGVLVLVFLLFSLGTYVRAMAPTLSDKVILAMPFYRDIVLSLRQYMTYYKLSMLVRSGVRLEQALKLAHQDAPRGAVRSDLSNAIKAVKNGRPWVPELKSISAMDRFALETASNRQQLAQNLEIVGANYQELYLRRLETLAPTLKVVAALLLVGAGGVIFGQVILPLLQFSANAF